MARQVSRLVSALGSVVLLSLVLTTGCDGDAGRGSDQPSSPASSPTGKAIPMLRMGDSGREIELEVGATASVSLSRAEYTWADPNVEGDAVTISEDVSDEGSNSSSWTITARAPGMARVGLAGSPACLVTTPPCDAPDILWSVRITVL